MSTRCVARFQLVLSASLLLSACAAPTAARARIQLAGGGELEPAGVDSCDSGRPLSELDPSRPLTVLVHGCNFSAGRFRTLARVFQAHGQQTICFNYDDRASLDVSSQQLRDAIETLSPAFHGATLTILGHSQGGLIARRALIQERKDRPLHAEGVSFRLVTVSAPFSGIRASSDCGSLPLRILSFGLTAAICQIVTGSKWHEIYPKSDFIRAPGSLIEAASVHLQVVTDERGACLRRNAQGGCSRDDFVFSLDEQRSAAVERDRRTAVDQIHAGHSAVVGEDGAAPWQLIHVLQAQKILASTPPEQRESMARWINALFSRQAS
jgi:pimeloyl-ACP methyl ester carboxylesterase